MDRMSFPQRAEPAPQQQQYYPTKPSQQHQWTVAHLAAQEPDAAPYLHDDWDDSTLASTPSLQRGYSCASATILRHGTEPSHIIISVERKLSTSNRALKKLWKLLQRLLYRLAHPGSGQSEVSTLQPLSLGVNGVMV